MPELFPGVELDAQVAEQVMGWRRFKSARGTVFFFAPDTITSRYVKGLIDGGELVPHNGKGAEVDAPAYSTDPAAALQVLDRLRGAGIEVTIRCFAEGFDAALRMWVADARLTFCAVGRPTLPEALCVAALHPRVGEILKGNNVHSMEL